MEYPLELVPTTPRRHITGTTALNIPATYRMGGDWHKHSTWFSTRPERLNDRDLTTEDGRLLDRLGLWGLRDARKGLALSGRVKSGHSWTPQNRPFPASRDGD